MVVSDSKVIVSGATEVVSGEALAALGSTDPVLCSTVSRLGLKCCFRLSQQQSRWGVTQLAMAWAVEAWWHHLGPNQCCWQPTIMCLGLPEQAHRGWRCPKAALSAQAKSAALQSCPLGLLGAPLSTIKSLTITLHFGKAVIFLLVGLAVKQSCLLSAGKATTSDKAPAVALLNKGIGLSAHKSIS